MGVEDFFISLRNVLFVDFFVVMEIGRVNIVFGICCLGRGFVSK